MFARNIINLNADGSVPATPVYTQVIKHRAVIARSSYQFVILQLQSAF